MTNFNYYVSDESVTVFVNGKTYTVDTEHPNFDLVKNGLLNGKYTSEDDLVQDIDQTALVEANLESDRVSVREGVVSYRADDGSEVQVANGLTKRLIWMLKRGQNGKHIVKFLENLMQNPSQESIMELYEFLEANSLPITGDGCFLAYKKVRADYTDTYSGSMDNSIGAVVEMPREDVDSDRNRTCSVGLHFASWDYMPQYGGAIGAGFRIVVVKINPADVVSFPLDYGNAKGRCARYDVVAELPTEDYRIRPYYSVSNDRAVIHQDDDPDELDYDDWEDEEEEFDLEYSDRDRLDW